MPDRSVDGQDVQPAIVVEIEPGRAEARVWQAGKPDALTGGLFFETAGSVVHEKIVSLAGERGDEQVFVAVVVEIARIDTHAALGFTVSAEGRARDECRIREGAVVPIDPQLVRLAVVGDEDVDPAVAIEVGGRDAERRAELTSHARRSRDVGEGSV